MDFFCSHCALWNIGPWIAKKVIHFAQFSLEMTDGVGKNFLKKKKHFEKSHSEKMMFAAAAGDDDSEVRRQNCCHYSPLEMDEKSHFLHFNL